MPLDQSALRPVYAGLLPCKICGEPARLCGVVDFNKSCEEQRGFRLPLAGVSVYYRRCGACGFVFTDAFDDWSHEEFRAHIYNDGYKAIDPDYQSFRPRTHADLVTQLWAARAEKPSVLDFGGGNDVLCSVLRANGFPRAVTYDPMVPEHAHRPDGKFDVVTCFETIEHLPDPVAGLAAMIECAAEPGLVLYTTVLLPPDFDDVGVGWWYVSPRNGHVSTFTAQALALAWRRHGYKTISLSYNLHLAFRTLPSYLAHLQNRADEVTKAAAEQAGQRPALDAA